MNSEKNDVIKRYTAPNYCSVMRVRISNKQRAEMDEVKQSIPITDSEIIRDALDAYLKVTIYQIRQSGGGK